MTIATADAPLLRRTRWRLMAWSGGLTLLVLTLLGAGIYVAVGRVLESQSVTQLQQRATEMGTILQVRLPPGTGIGVGVPAVVEQGFAFLGPASGTLAMIVGPDDEPVGLTQLARVIGLPYREGVDAARRDGTHLGVTELRGSSVRVYSRAVDAPDGTLFVVQVVADRRLEEQALRSVLQVLILGGLLVVVAGLGLGYLYAGRALVPIRESLRRQREFAADVSHELRTPLSVVQATVADLERRPSERIGDASGDLREIAAQTDRLTELIEELLLFARAESGSLELDLAEMDLSDAAVAAVGRLQRLADEHQVRIEAQVTPVPIRGDARRLEQLAAILIDNAIRHAPAQSVVVVKVAKDGQRVELVVEDGGPGIPADQLMRIFDRFHRLPSSRRGGVGLGLAIARWIAELHGGTVRAENRPEGGARLVVNLPG
jgi:two-component system sensor histidine kinase CiaH